MTRTRRRPAASQSSVWGRAAASVLTLAVAGGVVGLATFGQFTDQDDEITRSVTAPAAR